MAEVWDCFVYIRRYTKVMPSDVRFAIVAKMLQAKGYYLDHVTGSHHIFYRPGAGSFSVPVYQGKVKYVYVRKIEKIQG